MSYTYYDATNGTVLTRQNAWRYLSPDMKLPDHVRSITTEAFLKKTKIKTITFPDSLSSIGARAFEGCYSLTEAKLPQSLRYLGPGAFRRCQSIFRATIPGSISAVPKNAFSENNHLANIHFTSGDQLTLIRQEAFAECTSLTSIVLPKHVEEVRERAFYRCKSLKDVRFSNELKVIGKEAFYFCDMDELKLPDSLEYLDESAFFKCSKLTTVTLPPSVKHIGKCVFHGCNRLQYLEIRHDPEYIGEWIINRAATIRCYKGSAADRYCQESGFKVEYL